MLFIGTMHYDLEGRNKLEKILTNYSGCRIAIEAPCNYFRQDLHHIVAMYRDTMQRRLHNLPTSSLKEIGQLLKENKYYEWTVPLKLQQKHQFELVFFDDPCRHIEEVPAAAALEDIFEAKEILALSFFEKLPSVHRYQLYKKALHPAYTHVLAEYESAHGQRHTVCSLDEKREERLTKRLEACQPEIVICGISHVIPLPISSSEERPLYQRTSVDIKSYVDLVP